jgi:hypothetical protein
VTRGIAALGIAIVASACAGQEARPIPPPVVVEPTPIATAKPAGKAAPDPGAAAQKKVREMLAKVARARGIEAPREVPSRLLTRDEVLTKIRDKVKKEIPPDVAAHEGEFLAALGLVPPEYDFVEGALKLIQGRIAGFYEPADHTMYLVDDLDDDEAEETLAHELEHALQDHAYGLKKLLDFVPGEGDRLAAGHAVAEGDAMSAQFDVMMGSAFNVPEGALRRVLALSNAVAETSTGTPHVLQESLIAPYAEGFSFVQQQRQRGGWAAVDAAWRTMPETTEQLMHPDKYAAREPPIKVAIPTLAALGPGYRVATQDVVGEQGLKLMLAEWTHEKASIQGAAGWGGDRYVVARRDDTPDRHTIAVGWKVVMDTDRDAGELAAEIKRRFGVACRERPTVGPIAWTRKGRAIAVAAGPYARENKLPKSAGNCALAKRWAKEILAP